MKKLFLRLLPFKQYEMKTKMSKEQLCRVIESAIDPRYGDYYGSISENGFFIAQKNRKSFSIGYSRNSFAPVASAKMHSKDGFTIISITMRMQLPICILFLPIYFLSALLFVIGLIGIIIGTIGGMGGGDMLSGASMLLVLLPFMQIILYFLFMRPAKKMKEKIEILLCNE